MLASESRFPAEFFCSKALLEKSFEKISKNFSRSPLHPIPIRVDYFARHEWLMRAKRVANTSGSLDLLEYKRLEAGIECSMKPDPSNGGRFLSTHPSSASHHLGEAVEAVAVKHLLKLVVL
jgi:hypothetical protein